METSKSNIDSMLTFAGAFRRRDPGIDDSAGTRAFKPEEKGCRSAHHTFQYHDYVLLSKISGEGVSIG